MKTTPTMSKVETAIVIILVVAIIYLTICVLLGPPPLYD